MTRRHFISTLLVSCALLFTFSSCGGGISQANYDKVNTGMTLKEVEGVLGSPTKNEIAGGGVGGLAVNGGSCTWESGDKKIVVTFLNDKVQLKTKAGF